MRQSYNLLNSEWNINKVNEFLIEKYGYDLFDFAYSMAVILSKKPLLKFLDIQLIRKLKVSDYKNVVEGVERLKKLAHDLSAHRLAMKEIENRLFPKERIYNIEELINEEINILQACLEMYKKVKGRPAIFKNIIASLWSLVMKDSEGIHFKNIDELSNWFYKELEEVTYRDKLNVDSSEGEILRFRKNFYILLEETKKDIFVYNYKTNLSKDKPVKKTYAFEIRFEKDDPQLYPLNPTSENDIASLIIFLN